MARKSPGLTTYPARFLTIAAEAYAQRPIEPMKQADEKMAIATRHHFNRFRKALALEGHPHAAAASDLSVTLQGDTLLFRPRGLWAPNEGTLAVDSLFVPGIDDRPAAGPDEHDKKLIEMFGLEIKSYEERVKEQGRAPESSAESTGAECAHEWDATGSFCLLCRVPRPE